MAKDRPGQPGVIRRFTAAAVTSAAGVLLVAGCAAGQNAQSVNQRPPIDAASANAGELAVRDAAVVSNDVAGAYPKGGDARLQLVIVNGGGQQAQLTSVSTPAAGSVELSSAGISETSSNTPSAAASSGSPAASGNTTPPASGTPSTSGPASTPTATQTTSASPSASPSDTGSASAPQNSSISVPAGSSVQIGFSTVGPNIVLHDLTDTLYPAQSIPLTLSFDNGTSVNVTVPVQVPSSVPSAPVISSATEASEPNG